MFVTTAPPIVVFLFIGAAANIGLSVFLIMLPRQSWKLSQRIRKSLGFFAEDMPTNVEELQGNRGLLNLFIGIVAIISGVMAWR